MSDNTINSVCCYLAPFGSYRGAEIHKELEKHFGESIIPVAICGPQKDIPLNSNDHIPILAVHRSNWESAEPKEWASALNRYCKKGTDWTLLIVFTAAWDNYYGDDAWRLQYTQDVPAERLCILSDSDFLEVIPGMAQYFKNTPLSKWRVDDFQMSHTPFANLTALTILSQGFLAVHSHQSFTPSHPAHKALAAMGWFDFCETDIAREILKPNIFDGGNDAPNSSCFETEYWRPVCSEKNEKDAELEWRELKREKVAQIQSEWKDCPSGRLLRAVRSPSAKEKNHETLLLLVAEAFLELYKLLGGEKHV